jgi:hypothetical protein
MDAYMPSSIWNPLKLYIYSSGTVPLVITATDSPPSVGTTGCDHSDSTCRDMNVQIERSQGSREMPLRYPVSAQTFSIPKEIHFAGLSCSHNCDPLLQQHTAEQMGWMFLGFLMVQVCSKMST